MQPCQQEQTIKEIKDALSKVSDSDNRKGERLARIEEKQDAMSKDISEIKQTMKDFIDKADSKYAPAWVAKLVYGLLAGGALYLLQAVLKNLGIK